MIEIYWGTNNGGWNKTHGQIERTPRLDSFELAQIDTWGDLFFCGTCKSIEVYYVPGDEKCTIAPSGANLDIDISKKHNGYGGSQIYFLCPQCGCRVRYLYLLTGRRLWCRACSRLNYKSQQRTRDSMDGYDQGLALVETHLEPPPCRIDGFSFCDWVPDRPRYMHQTTYKRYLRRFLRYREQYAARTAADLQRLLRRL